MNIEFRESAQNPWSSGRLQILLILSSFEEVLEYKTFSKVKDFEASLRRLDSVCSTS